jgi:DeoR family deoxyribose operon repressor
MIRVMEKSNRLNDIINILKNQNAMSIKELASHFSLSEMTIRRDLLLLQKENIVRLIHGGAIFNSEEEVNNSFREINYKLTDEEIKNIDEKKRIVQKAISLIEPDETIMIDSGTTTLYLAKALPVDMPVTVVCWALNIFNQLTEKQNCKKIMPGGYFHEETEMFESVQGIDLIKSIRASKAFISAGGIHFELGITCPLLYEAKTKRAAIDSSMTSVLLIDSSKIGKICTSYMASLEDIKIIISNIGMPKQYEDLINKLGIQLYLV